MDVAYQVSNLGGNGESRGIGNDGAIDPRGPPENSGFLEIRDRQEGRVPRSRGSNRIPPAWRAWKTPQGLSRKEFMNAVDNAMTEGVTIL